jgi:hypothetical protein
MGAVGGKLSVGAEVSSEMIPNLNGLKRIYFLSPLLSFNRF